MLVGLAYFVVLAVVTVLFIVRRRRGEVAVVQGLAVLAVLAIVVLLLLALGLAGPMVETMGQAGQFVMVFVLLAVLLFLGLFGMLGPLTLAGCWAVGEADCHTIWPWRIIGPLSLAVRGRFRQVAVAEQLLAGTWLAGTYLGFEALLALALDRSASSIAGLGALVMLLPGAGAGIKAFYFSATTVLIGGVLIVTLVRRFTRRNWIGVAAGTLIAALPLAVRPTYPGGSVALGAILAFLMTAGALVVFTRTGALAAAAGVYVAVALEGAYPLVLTGNPEHVAGGLLGVALALAPAGIGLLSLWHPAAESETGSLPSYVKKALDRLRIAEEFEVARKVQLRLLPERPPLLPGLDIAGTCVPANEVAGDYFDYFPERDGNLAVAVGDVSGKGVPAALYMTLTKSYMLTQAGAGLDPVRLLSRVNRHLRKNLARGTFVTMAYASIDRESSTLTYARAGHNPPLLVRADGSTECLTASGVALGSSVPSTFESITRSERVVLCRGDVLLLYTDGITEAMNTNGDEYGEERLTASALVAVRKHGSAAAILDAILHDARSFAGRAPQHDDITLVVVRMA
jgi:hypothetical protein